MQGEQETSAFNIMNQVQRKKKELQSGKKIEAKRTEKEFKTSGKNTDISKQMKEDQNR